jgi:hypothetical protein
VPQACMHHTYFICQLLSSITCWQAAPYIGFWLAVQLLLVLQPTCHVLWQMPAQLLSQSQHWVLLHPSCCFSRAANLVEPCIPCLCPCPHLQDNVMC